MFILRRDGRMHLLRLAGACGRLGPELNSRIAAEVAHMTVSMADSTFNLPQLGAASASSPLRSGYSLPRAYYTDPAIFERDLERMLLRHWFCAGHISSIPRAGDYLVVELGSESVIIVRTTA